MLNKLMSHLNILLGVVIGIIIVSTIRHGGLNWVYIGETLALSALLLFSLIIINVGAKRTL